MGIGDLRFAVRTIYRTVARQVLIGFFIHSVRRSVYLIRITPRYNRFEFVHETGR
jgi:hypothetical protein